MDLEANIPKELTSNVKDFLVFLKYEKGLSDNTISSYKHDLQRYVKFISIDNKCKTINDVKLSVLKDFFYLLYDCYLTPQTQNRYLSAIRGFHKYLWEEEIIKADITPKIKLHKTNRPIPDVLSVEQIDILLQIIDTLSPVGIRDKAIIEVFYACGMRVSELINLKLQDCFLDEELVRVIGKGNKERIVPIGKEAIFCLNEYLNKSRSFLIREQKKTDIVFLNQHGRKLTRMGIWWLLDNYVQKNNLPFQLHPHIFRHSYATHLLEGGVDLRIVQELLGHSSVNTTQIYTHINNTYLQEVYRLCHPRAKLL